MYFYLILGFQAYCIYHMYKNKNSYYWALLIFLVPVLGCIIYLLTQMYNKQDAEKITENIVHAINPTKKVKDLEKQLEFAETYQNRVNLAGAYLQNKDYNNAITHYLVALEDDTQNTFYATRKLIEAYFNVDDYNNVINYAEKIKDNSEFKKSKTQFLYGLALERVGKMEEAEANLRPIDIRYSFYEERLILAKFLKSINKNDDAKEILNEISMESQNMTKTNRSLYRGTINEVEKLLVQANA